MGFTYETLGPRDPQHHIVGRRKLGGGGGWGGGEKKASRLELRQRDVWTVQAQARKDEAVFPSLLLLSVRLARGGSKRTGCVDPGLVTSISSAEIAGLRTKTVWSAQPHHRTEMVKGLHFQAKAKKGEGAERGRPGGGGSSIQVRVSGCLWSALRLLKLMHQSPDPHPSVFRARFQNSPNKTWSNLQPSSLSYKAAEYLHRRHTL